MRHPQNADGRFWIHQEECVGCQTCTTAAPANVRYDEDAGKSYVFRQPADDREAAMLREAITSCPVEAPREG